MKKAKALSILAMMTILIASLLIGCGGSINTVEICVLSHQQYLDKAALENATQPDKFEVGQNIYASIQFIESPLGMEYNGKWYINGNEIKSETKEMITDKSGIIIFSLEAKQVTVGMMRFEILYGNDVLFSKELPVQ